MKLWEKSVEVNVVVFSIKNAKDLLHSKVYRIVLKRKSSLGSTGFSSMLHHELPLAKQFPGTVPAHESEGCSSCFHFPNHISSF